MKKIRTRSMFDERLDTEIGWRVQEIADIKGAIRAADPATKRSLIRAGIPILYAHWEGFVKQGSEYLLNYINNQGHSLRELAPCFIVYGAKRKILNLMESSGAKDNIAVVEFFLNNLNRRAELATIGSVNTESNLRSWVFERIAHSLGIDTSRYETKYTWIDKSLIDRRNGIAHGEHLDVNQDQFREMADIVIELLRDYKLDLENLVHKGRYLTTQPPAIPF